MALNLHSFICFQLWTLIKHRDVITFHVSFRLMVCFLLWQWKTSTLIPCIHRDFYSNPQACTVSKKQGTNIKIKYLLQGCIFLAFCCNPLSNVFSVARWNETYGNANTVNETEAVGCPSVQTWCYYIPAMTITQFILGYAFTAVGYPIGVTLIQTIFSKVLGPRPQVRRYG